MKGQAREREEKEDDASSPSYSIPTASTAAIHLRTITGMASPSASACSVRSRPNIEGAVTKDRRKEGESQREKRRSERTKRKRTRRSSISSALVQRRQSSRRAVARSVVLRSTLRVTVRSTTCRRKEADAGQLQRDGDKKKRGRDSPAHLNSWIGPHILSPQ